MSTKTNADYIRAHREKVARENDAKRVEFWVPKDLTKGEKRQIQEWMDDIIEDIRNAHEAN